MNPAFITASLLLMTLTDEELCALNNAVVLGDDPRECGAWRKTASLFTELSFSLPPGLSPEMRLALDLEVERRGFVSGGVVVVLRDPPLPLDPG